MLGMADRSDSAFGVRLPSPVQRSLFLKNKKTLLFSAGWSSEKRDLQRAHTLGGLCTEDTPTHAKRRTLRENEGRVKGIKDMGD